jgi:hypothetical protein
MWATLFALGTAAAVWFSAASLSIELGKANGAAKAYAAEPRHEIPTRS